MKAPFLYYRITKTDFVVLRVGCLNADMLLNIFIQSYFRLSKIL